MINMASPNLNLLKAFEALFLERHVGRAAKRIGVTQPAMSNILSRLRRTVGDQLFIRSSRGMLPTPRAAEIYVPVCESLKHARLALGGFGEPNPAAVKSSFRIAASDYAEVTVLPKLVRRLQAERCAAILTVIRSHELFATDYRELTANSVDFCLGFLPETIAGQVRQQPLTKEQPVVICARRVYGNRKLDLRHFVMAPQARVSRGPNSPGALDDALSKLGLARNIRLSVPSFLSLAWVVAKTELLGVVPRRLAEIFAPKFHLQVFPLPLQLPPFPLRLLWHERNDDNPIHQYLRTHIKEAAR